MNHTRHNCKLYISKEMERGEESRIMGLGIPPKTRDALKGMGERQARSIARDMIGRDKWNKWSQQRGEVSLKQVYFLFEPVGVFS